MDLGDFFAIRNMAGYYYDDWYHHNIHAMSRFWTYSRYPRTTYTRSYSMEREEQTEKRLESKN